jgi:hypothetical protein
VRHERLDLGDELLGDAGERLLDAAHVGGLGHVVGGPGGERVEGRRRAALGERGEHDDRDRAAAPPQRPDRLDAVHHGHLDVHGDQVRRELLDLGLGDLPVGGGADDVDRRVTGEGVGHQSADDDGVVDHQHADPRHADLLTSGRRGCPGVTLPIGRGPAHVSDEGRGQSAGTSSAS